MGIAMLREQAAGLTRDQRNAFIAAWLGWAMDAFDYFLLVFVLTKVAEQDRYPAGEQVNFSKLPLDFGIVHYASDTPFTQARTLGARGMSYYGMDSTYATSIAILRRIFTLEGALS